MPTLDRRERPRRLMTILCLVLVLILCGSASPMAAQEPPPAAQRPTISLHDRLEGLEREIRARLAHPTVAGLGQAAEPSDRLRDRVRHLEVEIAGHPDPRESAVLRRKLRAIESLLSSFGHAASRDGAAGRVPPRLSTRAVAVNDACENALPIELGDTLTGHTRRAGSDGEASCGASLEAPDVWFKYSALENGRVSVDTLGSRYDTVLSVHRACPGKIDDQIRCNDDASGLQSALTFTAEQGQDYWIRVSGFGSSRGVFRLRLGSGGQISGTVTAAATGEPVTQSRIGVHDADGRRVRTAVSDDGGGFTFEGFSRVRISWRPTSKATFWTSSSTLCPAPGKPVT